MFVASFFSIQTTAYTPEKRRLAGNTKVDGTASPKRIVVTKRDTLQYLSSTVSDALTGNWQITGLPVLPEKSLKIEIIDDTQSFDPIAFDNVTCEV